MVKISSILQRGLLSGLAVLLVAVTPMAVFADDSPVCTPPPDSQTGVHHPVGADASTYSYNCDTGLWENDHFTYNPATGTTTPKDAAVYTYNAGSGKYDTTLWTYNAPSNHYVTYTQSVAQPPAGATVVGGPAPVSTIGDTGPSSNNTINNNGTSGGSISNTGPNSNNTINGSASNGFTDLNSTNASVNNILLGQATTGNSIVIGNTTAGNAATGNASNLVNSINMLQSASNALGGNTVTFVANIDGDVNGDFMLDSSLLSAVQPAGDNASALTGNNNLTINNQVNEGINNNINLASKSGDATVANNTTGGNATSGSATAIANVVNLINSAITSGSSFVGVININGNLNGDILVPPNLIDQLVASNVPTVTIATTGPDSNNSVNNSNSNNVTATNTNNQGITNNVKATASSGQADVSHNTSAGSATSGNASNNITAFNLTGSQLIGANDILVFVNVFGNWVGMIVNAPAGATAAELGGGITTNTGPDSNNTTNNQNTNNTSINDKNNQTINNNITVGAESGNAAVTGNTKGGNATSGDAKTAVNLLNVEGTQIALSHLFGILFINVFGSWHGSFGVNTSAGDPIAQAEAKATASGAFTPAAMRVFRFVPTSGSNSATSNSGNGSAAVASNSNIPSNPFNAALAAKSTKSTTPVPQLQSAHRNLWLPLVSLSLFTIYVIVDVTYNRSHKAVRQI